MISLAKVAQKTPGVYEKPSQGLVILFQQSIDSCHNHVECRSIKSSLGDDDIGVSFRRLDKLQVHRTDGQLILFDDRLGRSSAFRDVTLKSADKAHIRIGIHEYLHIEHLPQGSFRKNEDAFHQDHTARLDSECPGGAAMSGEIVNWHLNRFPIAQRGDVLDQQTSFERVGMVKIDLRALRGGKPTEVFIIRIVLEKGNSVWAHTLKDFLRNGCFART